VSPPNTAHREIFRRGTDAPAKALFGLGALLALLGGALFVGTIKGADPDRGWRAYHVNFLFFTGLALGAIIFAAIQKVTKAKWGGSIVRFAQATSAFLPMALILFLVLFLGRDHIFPWIAHPTPIRGKWLTVSWVFWRDLASLVLVFGIAIAFVLTDLKPDVAALKQHVSGWRRALYDLVAGDYADTAEHQERVKTRLSRLAPVLILVYAYASSLIAFDLIMSLAPSWTSNLFGAWFFMGAHLTGLTMLGLMMLYWRRKLGLYDVIGKQQLHDLGKLIFGFSVFWAYLMYSQFLVIWYGNLPEETGFVFRRLWGEWRPIGALVFILVFLVPFWGLIWVKAKITPFTFGLFATISLCGMWLERYLLVEPSLISGGPQLGLTEIGITAGFLGLFLLCYGCFVRAFPMVSPRLTLEAQQVHS